MTETADEIFARMRNDVGPGWQKIIEDCHNSLRTSCPDYLPVQIKEKFGGLRFYVQGVLWDSPAYESIREAERLSETTCESCGEPGTIRPTPYWYRCVCDEHYNQAITSRA